MAIKNVGFFGMLNNIYNMVGSLASAGQRGANALDHLGEWAEVKSQAFVNEAKLDMEEDLLDRKESREERRAERRAARIAEATDVQPRLEGVSA
jgi:hypothetical protein